VQTPPPGKSFARALEILRGIVSLKWPAPAGKLSRPGLSFVTPASKNRSPGTPIQWGVLNSAKGPVSRILSCAVIPLGAASPRTLISDLPGGFGKCSRHPCDEDLSPGTPPKPPGRIGPMRSSAGLFGARFPPYLVLLRVGFTLPRPLQDGRCALAAPFHPYPGAGVSATASVPGKPGQLGSCVSREALDRKAEG
jgi:hypothetical protein